MSAPTDDVSRRISCLMIDVSRRDGERIAAVSRGGPFVVTLESTGAGATSPGDVTRFRRC